MTEQNKDLAIYYADKVVAVTGGTGSVGMSLVRKLLDLGVSEVRCIDVDESKLFDFEQEMQNEPRLQTFHANIINDFEMRRVLSGVDLVFHAAALKHVPSCERSPFSAVETNILGVQSVIRNALECGVEKVLFTSTDKAVAPTNVMGASKLMGERLFSAANILSLSTHGKTIFASTRFGNVAGSRGSVIPLFCRQIAKGGPVTLTDKVMTRFMMSMDEAVTLLLESLSFAKGGEIFITKMPALRIVDLAETMVNLIAPVYGHDPENVEIKEIGSRPGEKLMEELCTREESRFSLESDDYICILPPAVFLDEALRKQHYESIGFHSPGNNYNSENADKLTSDEIRDFLLYPGVLPDSVRRAIMEKGK